MSDQDHLALSAQWVRGTTIAAALRQQLAEAEAAGLTAAAQEIRHQLSKLT